MIGDFTDSVVLREAMKHLQPGTRAGGGTTRMEDLAEITALALIALLEWKENE